MFADGRSYLFDVRFGLMLGGEMVERRNLHQDNDGKRDLSSFIQASNSLPISSLIPSLSLIDGSDEGEECEEDVTFLVKSLISDLSCVFPNCQFTDSDSSLSFIPNEAFSFKREEEYSI